MAETSLHRELKALYAGGAGDARREVRWGGYRIDVVKADELVEIQHGSLAAIRGKVARLLERHRVRVVKPIVVEKRLVKRARAGAAVVDARRSPKRGSIWELFHELVYFVPRLSPPAADVGSAAGGGRGMALPRPRSPPPLARGRF